MDEEIRESDVRQVIRLGKTQYWDAVNALLHHAQQHAIALEGEVGEASPMTVFARWCTELQIHMAHTGAEAVTTETARLDSPPPEEPPETDPVMDGGV